ncbi:stalk domain-containing protein [Vallitalea maricola]|uniref:Uncharacterized protein n=1 Tax=Vallitalea maricola TaxID=3074433 RepID=A0ACB5UIK8_9FIRM|nr:hypothetical protein AN2V17_16720 [Vallitalea sp. AN17-2]
MIMKRRLAMVLSMFILLSLPQYGLTLHATANTAKIIVDGEEVIFTEDSGMPFIDENNRTQVPFRITLEQAGAVISWDDENRTAIAKKDDITVKVPIDKNYIIKNGRIIYNDTVSLVKNGRTYLPIRVVMQALGYEVGWDNAKSSVLITPTESVGVATDEPIYYVNMMSDMCYYNNEDTGYRIYRLNNDGTSTKISENKAYTLGIIGDTIYYMNFVDLEREDGFVQRGTLWQINKDGTEEKAILEDVNIFTMDTDGEYIYFTSNAYGQNIMRMKPSGEPEIFLKDCLSYKIYYNDGQLYYLDKKDNYSTKRIDVNTLEKKLVTDYRLNYYAGYMMLAYQDYFIMNWDDTGNSIALNMKDGTYNLDIENLSYRRVSEDVIITVDLTDWENSELKFIDAESFLKTLNVGK